jgi:CrcB protein
MVAIALGGAFGAVLRFLLATSIYNGLGRAFPYGTLAVNLIGSLLIGLLTTALVVEKIALSVNYRAAILVGFLGSFTTFSTFSLDTVYLLEQGQLSKAGMNVFISLVSCFLAVWIGLLTGKALFSTTNGLFYSHYGVFPYGLVIVNSLLALLIGIITSLIWYQLSLSTPYLVAIVLIIMSLLITFSCLCLLLQLLDIGYNFVNDIKYIASILWINLSLCSLFLFLGWVISALIQHH